MRLAGLALHSSFDHIDVRCHRANRNESPEPRAQVSIFARRFSYPQPRSVPFAPPPILPCDAQRTFAVDRYSSETSIHYNRMHVGSTDGSSKPMSLCGGMQCCAYLSRCHRLGFRTDGTPSRTDCPGYTGLHVHDGRRTSTRPPISTWFTKLGNIQLHQQLRPNCAQDS